MFTAPVVGDVVGAGCFNISTSFNVMDFVKYVEGDLLPIISRIKAVLNRLKNTALKHILLVGMCSYVHPYV